MRQQRHPLCWVEWKELPEHRRSRRRAAGELSGVELRWVIRISDIHVIRIRWIVNHDDADRAEFNIVHVADRVVVIEPHACRGPPAERIPSILESAIGRHTVALLERAGEARYPGPQRGLIRSG